MVELQPKDILSIDLECFTRFALNDAKEGKDKKQEYIFSKTNKKIMSTRLFHIAREKSCDYL